MKISLFTTIKILVLLAYVAAVASALLAADADKAERVNSTKDVETLLRECVEDSRKFRDLDLESAPLRKRIISYYETNSTHMPVAYALMVGSCMGKEGDFRRAARLAETYVAVYTNDSRAWEMLGTASYMLDHKERALEAYEKAVALGDEKCYAPLAGVAFDLNRLDAVREVVPRMLRLKASEEAPKFMKLENLGALVVYARRADEREVFLKALEGEKVEDILSREDVAAAVDKACQEFHVAELETLCQKVHEAVQSKAADPKK